MQYRMRLGCGEVGEHNSGSDEVPEGVAVRTGRDSPGTGFRDSYPWPCEVLPEPLIVLREATELELGHRLLVWTGVHRLRLHSGTGRGGRGWTTRAGRGCSRREKRW